MKCVNCHNKMNKTERFCDRCGFDMEEYKGKEYTRMAARVRNRWLLRIGTLVVLVGVGTALLMKPSQVEVGTALLSTVQTIRDEMGTMVEELPLLSHITSMKEEVATTQISLTSGENKLQATLTTDPEGERLRADVDVDGFGFLVEGTVQATLEQLTVQMDRVDGCYGIDLTTLKEDLEDFVILNLAPYAAYYDYGMVSGYDEIWPEIKTHLTDSATQIITNLQVEEVGEQSLTLNDVTVSATGYRILWDYNALERELKELGQNLIQSPVLMPYIQTALTALQQYSRYLAPADVEELLALWNDQVEGLVEELKGSSDVQMVYLYQGRAVMLATLDENLERGWAVALNLQGHILDYLAVGSVTQFQMTPLVALSARIAGDALEMEVALPYGEDVIVDYDRSAVMENLVIRRGYDIWTFDVDSSETDRLKLSGNDWIVDSTLGASEDWFIQDEDYQNVLRLSLMEYFSLAKQLGFM